MLCAVSLSSCADVQPHVQPCLEGHVYGFWGGLWHGIIAPFALVGSWFSDDIAVWAVNNNGGGIYNYSSSTILKQWGSAAQGINNIGICNIYTNIDASLSSTGETGKIISNSI